MTMTFAAPEMFWGMVSVVIFAGGLYLLSKVRRKRVRRFLDKRLLPEVAQGYSSRQYLLRELWLVAAAVFSVVALARPQWGFQWQEVRRSGSDILFAVDVSKSMLTEDIRPTRLDRVKLAVRDFLKRLGGDRVGIIAFSGDAFLVCPLTVDMAGVLLSLEDLNAGTIPRGGTNIGSAIAEGMRALEKMPVKSSLLVLITDGESLEGDPLSWAKKAAEKGIRIATIGVGTENGEMVRVPDEKGQMVFLKDPEGNFVKSRLNEPLLRQVAALTGGAYIRASGADFGLDYLYDEQIAKTAKRDEDGRVSRRMIDRFQYPLVLVLLCLFAEMFVTMRKR
ncbi:MAG: VWA domain-containing protein [Elusimicrobia bacterium]|nr:VWA domain-containing protein [Elusimicrobiota bacterium]